MTGVIQKHELRPGDPVVDHPRPARPANEVRLTCEDQSGRGNAGQLAPDVEGRALAP